MTDSRSGGVLHGDVLRLPPDSVAPGCAAWDGESARHWTRALPARPVPVRVREPMSVALPVTAVAGAGLLGEYGGLPGWVSALVALHLVWPALRPEAAAVVAPVAATGVLTAGDALPLPARLALVAGLTAVWAAVCLRLAARRRQRAAGLAAARGVTAVAPRGLSGRSARGTFLMWAGLGTVAAGAVLWAATGLLDDPGDRRGAPAAGWCLAGLGLTLLLSAALGRCRAAALHRAPVPVLRVLVRENGDLETEVHAADDPTAARPLFTVSTAADPGPPGAGGEGEGDGAENENGSADELRELIGRVDDGRAGPLREAVLYGVPFDGAEVVLLAAAGRACEPPVVEASLGPVRPVTEVAFRQRVQAERRKAGRAARDRERRGAAAAVVAERAGQEGAARTRRWRAGWADWLAVTLTALFLALYLRDGWWGDVYALVLTLLAALLLPRRLAWRITADREGLWFNGFRGARGLAWDDVRAVECEGVRLRITGRRAASVEWTVASPRWPWLERRLGRLHPYERTAAEITAMWRDPALRPADAAGEPRGGRPLWPLGVAFATAGATALLLLR